MGLIGYGDPACETVRKIVALFYAFSPMLRQEERDIIVEYKQAFPSYSINRSSRSQYKGSQRESCEVLTGTAKIAQTKQGPNRGALGRPFDRHQGESPVLYRAWFKVLIVIPDSYVVGSGGDACLGQIFTTYLLQVPICPNRSCKLSSATSAAKENEFSRSALRRKSQQARQGRLDIL